MAVGSQVDQGAVHILFMNADGTVDRTKMISNNTGGFGAISVDGKFGASVAGISDVNDDTILDLAVGEPGANAFHVMLLSTNGSVISYTTNTLSSPGYGKAIVSFGVYYENTATTRTNRITTLQEVLNDESNSRAADSTGDSVPSF